MSKLNRRGVLAASAAVATMAVVAIEATRSFAEGIGECLSRSLSRA